MPTPDGDRGRRLLLRLLQFFTPPDHERLAFFENDDEPPTKKVSIKIYDVEMDFRIKIKLPKRSKDWAEEDIIKACNDLARLYINNYPKQVLDCLRSAEIHRDQVAALCDARGWRRPSFWFAKPRPSTTERTTAAAEKGCGRWLREQAGRSTRWRKEACWREAKARFPGLARRAFNRKWEELAPDAWRKPGRPRGR